jgi:PncC family amidohydrolase
MHATSPQAKSARPDHPPRADNCRDESAGEAPDDVRSLRQAGQFMMAAMTDFASELSRLAQEVAAALQSSGRQLVLAESCTAGLVAASLGSVPGISQNLCGSAVVYQERTKVAWLGVSEATLQRDGAVSEEVADEMATTILKRTPFADLSAAVTGHLGPDAPAGLDGVVFIAVKARDEPAKIERHLLGADAELTRQELRVWRQVRAAEIVLRSIIAALSSASTEKLGLYTNE